MFKINKNFIFGVFLMFGILLGFYFSIPDGKLHLVFCDVGQGDGIYIRMPNQTDMLIDGGPSSAIITCLGKYMPFYDREIDLVVLTHPQKDHLAGLIDVLERYKVKFFVTVPVSNSITSYDNLIDLLKTRQIPISYMTASDRLRFENIEITAVWPDKKWLADDLKLNPETISNRPEAGNILGVDTEKDLNLYSLYLLLNYGNFQALFTGDGGEPTQKLIYEFGLEKLFPDHIQLLKVPHHGSRTGLGNELLNKLNPDIAVIQVGKNSYGHPNREIIDKLNYIHSQIFRNDLNGDIEVITNGREWQVKHNSKNN